MRRLSALLLSALLSTALAAAASAQSYPTPGNGIGGHIPYWHPAVTLTSSGVIPLPGGVTCAFLTAIEVGGGGGSYIGSYSGGGGGVGVLPPSYFCQSLYGTIGAGGGVNNSGGNTYVSVTSSSLPLLVASGGSVGNYSSSSLPGYGGVVFGCANAATSTSCATTQHYYFDNANIAVLAGPTSLPGIGQNGVPFATNSVSGVSSQYAVPSLFGGMTSGGAGGNGSNNSGATIYAASSGLNSGGSSYGAGSTSSCTALGIGGGGGENSCAGGNGIIIYSWYY